MLGMRRMFRILACDRRTAQRDSLPWWRFLIDAAMRYPPGCRVTPADERTAPTPAHPHRGHGLGIALLADNLARIDAEHMPAYLESSNPANNARYSRLGFEQRGAFSVIDGGPIVTTMWRSAR